MSVYTMIYFRHDRLYFGTLTNILLYSSDKIFARKFLFLARIFQASFLWIEFHSALHIERYTHCILNLCDWGGLCGLRRAYHFLLITLSKVNWVWKWWGRHLRIKAIKDLGKHCSKCSFKNKTKKKLEWVLWQFQGMFSKWIIRTLLNKVSYMLEKKSLVFCVLPTSITQFKTKWMIK